MRRTELDSLRGVAAFAVLLWHATASSLHTFLVGANLGHVDGFWYNALMYSPLRIFSAGPEAVWLFFALSGFVLVRSAARPGYRWDAYYPSRIIRLYLPVIGAVLLTAALFFVFPRAVTPANRLFVGVLPTSYPFHLMVLDATLLNGTSAANVPLWSLQWEVLFSILLPVYVLLARKFPRISTAVAVASVLASVWTGSLFLLYMPMFLIGAVLGCHWETIAMRLDVLRDGGIRGASVGVAGFVIAVCLITSSYSSHFLVDGDVGVGVKIADTAFTIAKLVGICMLLTLAMTWSPLRRVLQWRPLVALGVISFSLYLTHGPIVIGATFLFGPGIMTTIIQIVASMAVAIAFYLVVEKRAHLLSRHIARRIRDELPSESAHSELPA